MDRQAQIELAEHFRALHHGDNLLLLPNAWDAGSARLFTEVGFVAVATTSGGIAWSLGYPDGEVAPLSAVLDAVRRIVRVTHLPVSVDFEGGYGTTSAQVGANVAALIDCGAVGINLEDGIAHTRLRDTADAATRVAAARAAAEASGIPIVVNARVDAWIIGGAATPQQRIEETVRRGRAYLEAGADCIYPIALAAPEAIAEVCARLDAPVNIGARVGLPPVPELRRLGVARVSVGTRLASIALGAARETAATILASGAFDTLATTFTHEDAERLFGH